VTFWRIGAGRSKNLLREKGQFNGKICLCHGLRHNPVRHPSNLLHIAAWRKLPILGK
jgi:hypothetical protein